MGSPPLDPPVMLTIEPDDALVLFEMLSRAEESEQLSIQHQAEDLVLSRLLGQLEKSLVAPFAPDYLDRLASARARLTGHTS